MVTTTRNRVERPARRRSSVYGPSVWRLAFLRRRFFQRVAVLEGLIRG